MTDHERKTVHKNVTGSTKIYHVEIESKRQTMLANSLSYRNYSLQLLNSPPRQLSREELVFFNELPQRHPPPSARSTCKQLLFP